MYHHLTGVYCTIGLRVLLTFYIYLQNICDNKHLTMYKTYEAETNY